MARTLVSVARPILAVAAALAAAVSGAAQGKSGSAFAVDRNGLLLTNAHVVDGCTELEVQNRTGISYRARVQGRDERNDLALLSIGQPLPSVARFRDTPARSGEDVIAVGFPLRGLLATDLNVSKGIISATAGLLNDTSNLQISASVQPGNSGGPLLDAAGLVAGVVVAKLDALEVAKLTGDIPQNVNFAIKGEVAILFLRSHGVEPVIIQSTRTSSVSVPDAVEAARGYSFVVECFPDQPTSRERAEAERLAAVAEEAKRRAEANARSAREASTKAEDARRARERAEAERLTTAAEETRRRVEADAVIAKELARKSEEARRAAERDVERIWAAHDRRIKECVRPGSVAAEPWVLMSLAEQWVACEAAGTIRPRVRVMEAWLASEKRDPTKVALNYAARRDLPPHLRQPTLDPSNRWLSIYAVLEGVQAVDRIELSLFGPSGDRVAYGNLTVKANEVSDFFVIGISDARPVWGSWREGEYTARVRVIRNTAEMTNFSYVTVMK